MTGKGGAGKTLLAAALARLLADRGKRVLLLESDPRENLHHLFAAPPSGGAVMPAGDRLAFRNANPRALLDQEVGRRLRVGALSRRVLASPLYQHFADGAPGLKELSLLGYALQVLAGEAGDEADVVVLDAPASGHGLSLLAAPMLVAGVITSGPLSAMARHVADAVTAESRCAIVVATLAEEVPVQETAETLGLIAERVGRPASLVIANAVWPADPSGSALWTARRAHNEKALARLARLWRGPSATVPLFAEDFGPALLAAACDALGPQLAGP